MKRTLTAFLSFLITTATFATDDVTNTSVTTNTPQANTVETQQAQDNTTTNNQSGGATNLEQYTKLDSPQFKNDWSNNTNTTKNYEFDAPKLEPTPQGSQSATQINLGEYTVNMPTSNATRGQPKTSNGPTPDDAAQESKNQSTSQFSNNALSGASMAATGIGAMMAASAWSEQNADDAADAQMRQYVATFKCDYGSGQIAYAGDTNVEVSGGNELIQLYTQYATLANDLKSRKTSLGMRPGIESEVVIDKSTTGLYDDTNDGITGARYASIAQAIITPDGQDAARLSSERGESANKLETGATVAGVGAIAPIFLKQ
ncbi:MAG: hypothetical protein J5679_02335 [Alphaproteobacteria bacterium]|nr:hypothetical protein [Alphaproteobacteria bacterium]